MLEFKIETPEGDLDSVTSNDVAQSFAQKGFQNVSISPDGRMISLTDANGVPGKIDVQKFVAGNAKIAGIIPTNVNYESIDTGLRASIGALGNHDDLKRRYLEGQLREKGLDDAEVIGSGDNFFYFDPKTGTYNALTNRPGVDITDIGGLTSLASPAAGLVGSALGGIAGATATAAPVLPIPGANIAAGVAGGALGGAAGGWAARGLVDSAAKMLNPALKPYLESEEIAAERGTEAAIDALGGGIGGFLTKIPWTKKALETGLASTTAAKTGDVAKGAGYLIQKPAQYLQSDALPANIARGVMENFVPVTGQMQLPALAMRSPELLRPLSRKLGERAAAKEAELTAKMFADEPARRGAAIAFAQKPSAIGEDLIAKLMAEEAAVKSQISREAAKATRYKAAPFVLEGEESLARQFAKGLRGQDKASVGIREATPGETLSRMTKGTRLEKFGQGMAEPVDFSVRTGRAIDKINETAVRGALKGTELIGRGLYTGGKTAGELGRAISPLENRLLMQQGLDSEEMRRRLGGR